MARRVAHEDADDASLVTLARGGSSDAFAVLYRRHAGAVRRVLTDHVHDTERQRDLLQDVFTKALVKLDSLRDPALFRPWVFQIARNVALDDLRTRSRMTLVEIDDGVVPGDPDEQPDSAVEVRALVEALQQGLAVLSHRDAAAVSMVVHLGFGPAEVAAALGITRGNAKVVLHRARTRLRAALEQQELLAVEAR